jgi:hypothetical protein
MEWVPTRGCFLEQVFRNEQVRRDIRDRVPGGGSFDTGVPGGKSRWAVPADLLLADRRAISRLC